MPLTNNKSVLLIAGPTASGKSAVAIAGAQARGGVIINADSMQVYRELRILTARPSVEEEQRVPHRLFGHIGGAEAYSTAAWLAEAEMEIQKGWANGQLPIICGGTGLYFTALEQGLAKLPTIDPEIREKWRNFQGDLHVELEREQHLVASPIATADVQRCSVARESIDDAIDQFARERQFLRRAELLAESAAHETAVASRLDRHKYRCRCIGRDADGRWQSGSAH